MTIKKLVLILSIFLAIISCKENPQYAEDMVESEVMAIKLPPKTPSSRVDQVKFVKPVVAKAEEVVEDENGEPKVGSEVASQQKDKKIIKDGDISVKSKDIDSSKKALDILVKSLDGYYENESLDKYDERISYTLKVRIPSQNFEKLLTAVENGTDELQSKNVQARDVTAEFLDIETRLSNKRQYLKRYQELLSKAGNVKDIIAIEENIRNLQEEIESSVGRLKYLGDQVSYSTLNVNLYSEKDYVFKPEPQDNFWERFKTSLSDGWNSIVNFFLWTIGIWPFIIIGFVVLYFVRPWWKKRRAAKKLL
ncbi:MAG: DUF4349 domain-containing protein [Flavobacterium sp.]